MDDRIQRARQEGLALTYQATDKDLPPNFWPLSEEEFWKQQYKSAGLGEENAR